MSDALVDLQAQLIETLEGREASEARWPYDFTAGWDAATSSAWPHIRSALADAYRAGEEHGYLQGRDDAASLALGPVPEGDGLLESDHDDVIKESSVNEPSKLKPEDVTFLTFGSGARYYFAAGWDRKRGKRSDLKITAWKDDEDQEGTHDDIRWIDDVVIDNAVSFHIEMLDDDLAYLHVFGERGTDDYVQLDITVVDGKLRIFQP